MSAKWTPSRIVQTRSGPLSGRTFLFPNHRSSAFLGVPYAKPPVGERRFKKPEPAQPWTEVRKCTSFGPCCHYRNPTQNLNPNEDCLFLNIFVPEAAENEPPLENLPVMFYIHGGGFILDSSTLLGDSNICENICAKGVIVVTLNYRLGFFGFLALDSAECPGNFGLWDMTLALKWTRENISAFGGNPERITVFGQSAGAVAVDMLCLSPHTRELFSQAITFAGSTHCGFVYMDEKYGREFALEYAKFLGFEDIPTQTEAERTDALLAFYRKAKARDLALGVMPAPKFKFRSSVMLPLCPVIDGDFFPKSLDELRKEAPPKTIINGVTQYEGLLFSVGMLESNIPPFVQTMTSKLLRQLLAFSPSPFVMRRVLRRFIPNRHRKSSSKLPADIYRPMLIKMFMQSRPDCDLERFEAILDEFLDPMLPDTEYVERCIEILSDFMFNYGMWKMAKNRVARGDRVYNYYFTYFKPGSIGLMGFLLPFEGPTHCLEIPYFFGKSIISDFSPNEKDRRMLNKFVSYLTNFAKTGDPNNDAYEERWEPVDADRPERYFLFDDEEYGMRDGFGGGRLPSWDRFFTSHPPPPGFTDVTIDNDEDANECR